jgi:hypothetical protein
VPVVILFAVIEKYLVGGLTAGSVKQPSVEIARSAPSSSSESLM